MREIEDLRRAVRAFEAGRPPGTPSEAIEAARELGDWLDEALPPEPSPGQKAVFDATGTGNKTP